LALGGLSLFEMRLVVDYLHSNQLATIEQHYWTATCVGI
jgi:hypothetical protein